jgi:hypothetical protein
VLQSAAHDNAPRRLTDVVFTMLVGQYLRDQAGDELVAISTGRLAEAEKLPDLDAVILDRATRPLVGGIELGWDAYLPG